MVRQTNESSVPNEIDSSIDINFNNIKSRYSSSINSDVILREFKFRANSKTYNAFIVCIDGMIDSDLVNNFLLRPLMQANNNSSQKEIYLNGIKLKKNKKFNLEKHILDTIIPQNAIKNVESLDELILRC